MEMSKEIAKAPIRLERRMHPRIQIRNLDQRDLDLIEPYWTSFSVEERRQRFHGQLGNDTIRRHLRKLDFSSVRMLGAFENGVLKGTAEMIPCGQGAMAELAIILHVDLKGKRVADRMMEVLRRQAQADGMDTIEAYMDIDNHAMRRLAQRNGYSVARNENGMVARSMLNCSHPCH
jgi:RimJ/RimL family protein N-acetyltransferase